MDQLTELCGCEGVNYVVCGYGGEGVECVGVRVAHNEQMQNLITQVCYEVLFVLCGVGYSLVPRPFLVGGVRKGRGRKGLVNNSAVLMRETQMSSRCESLIKFRVNL